MSLTAGTNTFTKVEDSARLMFAKSASVRAYLGASTESQALDRIFIDEVPRTDQINRDDWNPTQYLQQFPCIIVSAPSDGKWFSVEMDSRDDYPGYKASFVFAVRFEKFANEAEDEQEQLRLFKNGLFAIIDDIVENVINEPNVFVPTKIEPLDGVYRYDFRNRQGLGHIIGQALLFSAEVR